MWWDGLCGTGCVWLRNIGAEGKPRFAAAEALIDPIPADQTGPAQPDNGLYADTADIDGDGHLGLLVGGYSIWQPEGRTLTQKETDRLAALDAQQEQLDERYDQLFAAALDDEAKGDGELSDEERKARLDRIFESKEYQQLRDELRANRDQIDELRPSKRREPHVWWYRRLAS